MNYNSRSYVGKCFHVFQANSILCGFGFFWKGGGKHFSLCIYLQLNKCLKLLIEIIPHLENFGPGGTPYPMFREYPLLVGITKYL